MRYARSSGSRWKLVVPLALVLAVAAPPSVAPAKAPMLVSPECRADAVTRADDATCRRAGVFVHRQGPRSERGADDAGWMIGLLGAVGLAVLSVGGLSRWQQARAPRTPDARRGDTVGGPSSGVTA